jgi:hypothetical protein
MFKAGMWYRLVPQLDPMNSPEVSIQIGHAAGGEYRSEGFSIDSNGNTVVWLTVYNNGKGTAVVNMILLSAPSL